MTTKKKEATMRLLIRTVIVLAIVWIGLLLSGYGVLMGSKENAAGLGIQCKYLTAQGVSTAQYIHSDSGVIGLTNCPVLRKSSVVVDNG
ncbi:hypothetical protein HMPREF9086_2773 [Enterobacter hormaechei ATCC 49162]|nr:hypothetical protein HMPREF9086_2773 [Enterobacter hormaechei ATCC 49162]